MAKKIPTGTVRKFVVHGGSIWGLTQDSLVKYLRLVEGGHPADFKTFAQEVGPVIDVDTLDAPGAKALADKLEASP